MTKPATITERGNGFPEVGDYVPGDDGVLYRIIAIPSGHISTHAPGQGNTIEADVELANWDDCDEDDVHSASATLYESDDDPDPTGYGDAFEIDDEEEPRYRPF